TILLDVTQESEGGTTVKQVTATVAPTPVAGRRVATATIYLPPGTFTVAPATSALPAGSWTAPGSPVTVQVPDVLETGASVTVPPLSLTPTRIPVNVITAFTGGAVSGLQVAVD